MAMTLAPNNRPIVPRSVCQIFYELKGGRVNYGQGHSHKFGHDTLGADYPGVFPEVIRHT
jgi:hypothetical protein